MTFDDFQLAYEVGLGIWDMGYTNPTPIQEQAIPLILEGNDLIGCAQTGTGKTAAFLLPMLHRFQELALENPDPSIKCLIIAPTRELAQQIDQLVDGLAYHTSVGSRAVYGGGSGGNFSAQKNALVSGADIIIATPGRLMQHLNLGYVKLDNLQTLILDEADKMLDMGFFEDIIKIVSFIPEDRQTLLFSATMPPKIRTLASRILKEPKQINLAVSKPAAGVNQIAYLTHDKQKIPLLQHLLAEKEVGSMLIFASRKSSVNEIERTLQKRGYNIRGIHSDKDQPERESILREFKNKTLKIIIATDILSRGIDVDDLSHVVNYDLPKDAEDYIHRVGRTARADKTGEAISFVNTDDMRNLAKVERLIEREVPKIDLPEELGEGPRWNPGGGGYRGGGRGGNRGGRGGNRGGGGGRGRGGKGRGGNRGGGGGKSGGGGRGGSGGGYKGKKGGGSGGGGNSKGGGGGQGGNRSGGSRNKGGGGGGQKQGGGRNHS